MTPRHWEDRTERLSPCPGSGKRAQHARGQVGFCPDCGVRTFTRSNLIRHHMSAPREMAQQRRLPRKPAL